MFNELLEFVRRSKRNTRIVYHVGNLAYDRDALVNPTGYKLVAAVGELAYRSYEQGLVELVQERVSPGRCSYIAIHR